jgi:ribosomal protein L12E/L44/L45/RPP1/RPP2
VEDADFQQLTFRVGQFVPEAHIPKLMEYVSSPETEEIVNPQALPTTPAVTAPATPEPPATAADLFGGETKTEPAPAETATEPAPTLGEPTMKDLRAQAKALGMKGYTKLDRVSLEDAIFEANEAQEEAKTTAPVETAPPAEETRPDGDGGVPSDADIAASLGL